MGPRGNMKFVLWNQMAAWAASLWGEGLAWCLLVRLSVSVPMGLHDYGPVLHICNSLCMSVFVTICLYV